MIRSLLALAFLAFCGTAGYYIATSPHEVEIFLQGRDRIIRGNLFEMAFWAFLASYLLQKALGFLYFIWRSPSLFSRNQNLRKKQRAESLLRKGLEEMILGHYPQAERLLIKGANLAKSLDQSTMIYYENAAIAADKQQADQRRDEYLLEARKDSGRTHFTLLNEAELAFNNQDYKQAEKYLSQLLEREPRNSKILLLLDQCYAAQNKWQDAWQLSFKLNGAMNEDVLHNKRHHYALSYLHDLIQEGHAEHLNTFWSKVPQELKREQDMTLAYVEALVASNQAEEAEQYLLQEIRSTQNLALIQAYSQLTRAHYARQLENMLQWEKQHAHDPIFLLAKARIAYKAQQYELALSSIEHVLQQAPSAEAFVLWAQILEALGQNDAALSAYRQGLTQQQALQGALLLPQNHE